MKILIILELVDIITGCLQAIKGKSYKTPLGLFSSKTFTNGVITHIAVILCVYSIRVISPIIDIPALYETCTSLFCFGQFVSILENVSACGVKLPKFIINIMENINDK